MQRGISRIHQSNADLKFREPFLRICRIRETGEGGEKIELEQNGFTLFLPLGVASCCVFIQLVPYDAINRNKVSIR
jgi:hypothetical protein